MNFISKTVTFALSVFAATSCSVFAQVFPSFGGERAGVSLASSLKIGIGARAAALVGTYTAIADDASSVYWNPAGMAESKSNGVLFSQCYWAAGMEHRSAAAVIRLADGEHNLGFHVAGIFVDPIRVTTEFQPLGTGTTFRYQSLQFSASYAKRFTDQFSAGITVRYVNEILGKASLNGILFDAGTFYRTGLGTSRFAVAVSNFGGKLTPDGTVPAVGEAPKFNGGQVSSFQSFDPPIIFRIGFATEPVLDETHRLTTAIQLDHPNDNSETASLGAEYAYTFSAAYPAQVFVRAGVISGADDERFAAGAGVFAPFNDDLGVSADYGYSAYSTLGGIHRISVAIKF
ncbi:hypothetical protein MASR2M18_12740 [Ignavibacteria bacterium]|nr:PorV/PorQ family protein [Bacteroidota bacterium]MCZ2133245.1 PorV/PorQ family protein [Bacteroidota bacterium]